MNLTIGYLYADLMNIYGDTGNIICLKKRAEWRGVKVRVKNVSIGDNLLPGQCDIFFFGGGQDQAQNLVSEDLTTSNKGYALKYEVDRGVPLLSICGGYQLLGEYYKPHKGKKLEGLGLFPVYTVASHQRMIGNIVIEVVSNELGVMRRNNAPHHSSLVTHHQLVGFENHSGKTYLKDGATPLGQIKKGFGNNGEDKTEGCIYKNAIGCYMHGSLLPKNPHLADWLLKKALEVKYEKEVELKPLDDMLELKTHKAAISRFG